LYGASPKVGEKSRRSSSYETSIAITIDRGAIRQLHPLRRLFKSTAKTRRTRRENLTTLFFASFASSRLN
jgi:hypothetical protein